MPKQIILFVAIFTLAGNIEPAYAQCDSPATFNILAGPNGTTAVISWTTVTNANSYDYGIAIYPATPPLTSLTNTTTPVILANSLTPGTKYNVCVRSVCSSGISGLSCDTFTTPNPPPTCSDPAFVFANATNSNSGLAGWAPVNGATGYEYAIQESPSGPPASGAITTVPGVMLSGLKSSTTYDFCVRAICGPLTSNWVCDTLNTPPGVNVKDVNVFGAKIFPNPVTDLLQVELPADAAIDLTDIRGVTMHRAQLSKGKATIDLSRYAPGIYILKLRTTEHSYSYKIQKH
jgi:hypothetical protein